MALALDLQEDLHSFERSSNQGHRNCRESASGGDLTNGILRNAVFDGDSLKIGDDRLAQIISLGKD